VSNGYHQWENEHKGVQKLIGFIPWRRIWKEEEQTGSRDIPTIAVNRRAWKELTALWASLAREDLGPKSQSKSGPIRRTNDGQFVPPQCRPTQNRARECFKYPVAAWQQSYQSIISLAERLSTHRWCDRQDMNRQLDARCVIVTT
jgi:hypothetical protein